MDVIQEALVIQTHADLLRWLQGDLQLYLPHQILVALWTRPGTETLEVDVISAIRGIRTSGVVNSDMVPLFRNLLARWKKVGHELFWLRNEGDFAKDLSKIDRSGCMSTKFKRMRSAMIHGINNERERDTILYVVFNQSPSPSQSALFYFKVLLPYIDAALRQLKPLRTQLYPELGTAFGLSQREREVMEWVRAGKTNEVIAVILGISPFTVKNHLKRIFRKLDVSNRAQAVNKIYEFTDKGNSG